MIFGFYRNTPQSLEKEQEKRILKLSNVVPVLFLVAFWLIKFSETVLSKHFYQLGVYPRKLEGLLGVLTSPFIHSDFKHLITNSVSFYVLTLFLFYFYRQIALRIFTINYLLAGILLWIIGRDSWHIGASGIIYGLATFLFFSGLFRGNIKLLTIALVTAFLYGSMFWGLFPTRPEVSWEAHLAGAFSGFSLSIFYRHQGPQQPQPQWINEDDDEGINSETLADEWDESSASKTNVNKDEKNGM
jgi:membrane associated rhomboid family serine protease